MPGPSDLWSWTTVAHVIAALFDIEGLLKSGGLALLAAIVFAESGLLVGFFLPGDSLLFIAGFLASNSGKNVLPALPWVILVCVVAAIVGDQVGYVIGRKAGPAIFNRNESRLFHPEHVEKANRFFDKHGSKTIVLARFVPIVRTFAPVVAGVGNMEYGTFVRFNVVGGLLWGGMIPALGFFLGQIDAVKNNIEIAIIAIVVLSVLPMFAEYLRHRKASSAQ